MSVSSDAPPDPFVEPVAFGQRMQILRSRCCRMPDAGCRKPRAVMGAHAVTVAVELHVGPESVRQAAAADTTTLPSRPRRARHRIEEARGYQLDGQAEAALAALGKAYEAAPETVRYNGYARRILLEEADSKSPAQRRRASELAVRIGALAA